MESSSSSDPSGQSSSIYNPTDAKDVEARKGSVTAQAYQMTETGKAPDYSEGQTEELRRGSVVEVAKARRIQDSFPPLRILRAGEEWLDRTVGVETRGVDRIPEEEKQPPPVINIFFFWWSLNVHIGVVPLGILGPEFGLSLGDSIAAAVVGTALGAMCTGFTGTLGPKVSCPPTTDVLCSKHRKIVRSSPQ